MKIMRAPMAHRVPDLLSGARPKNPMAMRMTNMEDKPDRYRKRRPKYVMSHQARMQPIKPTQLWTTLRLKALLVSSPALTMNWTP